MRRPCLSQLTKVVCKATHSCTGTCAVNRELCGLQARSSECPQRGGGFNRSMQHTKPRQGGRSVAREATTADLLLCQPEGADVEALEGGMDPSPDCAPVQSLPFVRTQDPGRDRRHPAARQASLEPGA